MRIANPFIYFHSVANRAERGRQGSSGAADTLCAGAGVGIYVYVIQSGGAYTQRNSVCFTLYHLFIQIIGSSE
jgi:hypothetical protein